MRDSLTAPAVVPDDAGARRASLRRLTPEAARWLEETWGRRSGACEAPLVEPADTPWLSLAILYEWLCSPRFVSGHEVFLRDDTGRGSRPATSAHDVSDQLARGATLQVRHLEAFLPRSHPVMELAADIERVSGEAIAGVSAFVTPPGTQALPAHSDVSDVVAVQLSGSKTWDLEGDVFTLSPGRLAYIRAGQVHEVRQGDDTLSLSLAVIMDETRITDALHARLHAILQEDPTIGATLLRRGGSSLADPGSPDARSVAEVARRLATTDELGRLVKGHVHSRQLPPWPDSSLWDPSR